MGSMGGELKFDILQTHLSDENDGSEYDGTPPAYKREEQGESEPFLTIMSVNKDVAINWGAQRTVCSLLPSSLHILIMYQVDVHLPITVTYMPCIGLDLHLA